MPKYLGRYDNAHDITTKKNLENYSKEVQTIIGDGSTTIFNLPHSLGTSELVVSVQDVDTNEIVFTSVIINENNVVLEFDPAYVPAIGKKYKVVMISGSALGEVPEDLIVKTTDDHSQLNNRNLENAHNASAIYYNNTESNIESTNIQGAVDELVSTSKGLSKVVIYNPSETYAPNAYCVHNGHIWMNTSGVSVTGVEPNTDYNVWNVDYSNPNLFINGWFAINQRGQSNYTTAGYTVDMWRLTNSTGSLVVSDNGIELTSSADNYIYIQQKIKNGFQKFKGKTITYSILMQDGNIYSITGVVPNEITSSTQNIGKVMPTNLGFTATSIYLNSSGELFAQIGANKSTTLSIRAVKLEIGSISTLANDFIPDEAKELIKCYQYLKVIESSKELYNGYVTASAKNLTLTQPISIEMVDTPDISLINGGVVIRHIDGYSTDTPSSTLYSDISLSLYNFSSSSIVFFITKSDDTAWGGLTNNTLVNVLFSGKIIFSCEP